MEIKIALRVYRTEESDLIESPWRFLFTNTRSERRYSFRITWENRYFPLGNPIFPVITTVMFRDSNAALIPQSK